MLTTTSEVDQELKLKISNGHARRMGTIENFFSIWQRQKMYKNFAIVAHFNKDIKTDKGLLFKALRSLLLKYPMLVSTVHKTDYSDLSKPKPLHDFIKVQNTLKFGQVVIELPEELYKIESKAEQLKYINTQIHWSYENDDLLWKIGFLDSNSLVFITNHCLSDGISAKYFFGDLVELLNDHEGSSDGIEVNNNSYLFNYSIDHKILPELPPALETIVNYIPSVIYMAEFFYNLFFIKNICYSSKMKASREDKFHYRLINIPAEDMSKIRESLNSHRSQRSSKITLTPYIQAIWLRSINAIVTPLNNPIWGYHDISIPGNARQYLPSSIDSDQFKYGANTSGVHKFFKPLKVVDWKVVNKYNDYLKRLFKTKKFLYNMGILACGFVLKYTNLDKTLEGELMDSPRNGSLFSNLGLFQQADDDSHIKIDDIIFSANGGASSETFSLSTISTVDNGMNLLIAVTEKDITSEKLDELVDHFAKGLLSYDEIK